MYRFPPPDHATEHGIVGVGGTLSPGMLLSAYSQGVFPWYSEGDPLLWWNPDPRFVLFTDRLHISKSLKKLLNKRRFHFSFDLRFREVIEQCSRVKRPGQDGTWITPAMIDAYTELHRLGFAHSLEVWNDTRLAGGLYGVSLGRIFCGESMFTLESGASKAGLVHLAGMLRPLGFRLIDSQVRTDNLAAMGAEDIPREEYLQLLGNALEHRTIRGSWSALETQAPDS
ncbi:MAG: leucyl/phenylalanyl-tRNA--protein transferase [Spirochaetales bacterium]|nr:leucyl/phenylalanyl-tRNA--protein transferase [Spirochaetales bacterium]